MSNLYMIDCVSTHHIRYCVKVETKEQLQNVFEKIDQSNYDASHDHSLTEFSQEFLGEKVISASKITSEEEYLKIFDEDNEYLSDWSEYQKLDFINNIDGNE